MTAAAVAVSSIREVPAPSRETVFSFMWSHLSPGLVLYVCTRAGVTQPPAGCWSGCWDDLKAPDRDALRPVLLDLLSGHEARRVEYRERMQWARAVR